MPTRLEELAASVPMPATELRRYLRRQIDQVRRARGQVPKVAVRDLVCTVCGGQYEVSVGRAQVIARNGETPQCPDCRQPRAAPGEHEYRWVSALPSMVYARAMGAMSTLRQ